MSNEKNEETKLRHDEFWHAMNCRSIVSRDCLSCKHSMYNNSFELVCKHPKLTYEMVVDEKVVCEKVVCDAWEAKK